MLTTADLIAKVTFLKIPPEAWDAIIPHGPKVSQALVEYMAAGLVRDIAKLVKDKAVQTKLTAIGKEMAGFASNGLVQGWEDGDDICPPYPPFPPRPWPWRGDFSKQEPSPQPWKISSVEQVVLADLLLSLADITSSRELGAQLKDAASALSKGAAGLLTQDFEKSSIKTRAR